MKRSQSTLVSYLYSALLIAGALAYLGAAPDGALGRRPEPQDSGSFTNVANSLPSRALTTSPQAHSRVPASQQKRVRHPALDFAALSPEQFQLAAGKLDQRALDPNPFLSHSSFRARPRGRAPPGSV